MNVFLSVFKLIFGFVLSIYLLFVTVFVGFHLYYANRILPGVSIAGVDMSGKTIREATSILEDKVKDPISFNVEIGKYEKIFSSKDIGTIYDISATIRDAFKIGRDDNFLKSTQEKIIVAKEKKNVDLVYLYNESDMKLFVALLKLEGTSNYVEPSFIYEGKIKIIEGKEGLDFDSAKLEDKLTNKLKNFDSTPLKAEVYQKSPEVTNEEMVKISPFVDEIAKKGLVLVLGLDEWTIPKEDVITFFRLRKNNGEYNNIEPNGIKIENMIIDVDTFAIMHKLKQMAPSIERSPSAQILNVDNGKVIDFKPSLDGRELLVEESANLIAQTLLVGQNKTAISVKSTSLEGTPNDYGIAEIIGVGKSKFVGSIPNRVYNVGLASSKVNGILVPPGEVFSFNKAVGEVSRRTGYKSALVISGGRTVLGDGGGLCQVSTTVFRAALDAGLPIVARSPHSYRVGYYEQDSGPGIDATVYVPSVDLKFKNDTEKYILLVSEFDAKSMTLKYTIYGTSDGRKSEITKPKILSRRSPPSPRYEEDPSLAKGVKRQVEGAVAGAVVEFNRKVVKDGVTIYDDVFKSNYQAWPAVYRIGTRE